MRDLLLQCQSIFTKWLPSLRQPVPLVALPQIALRSKAIRLATHAGGKFAAGYTIAVCSNSSDGRSSPAERQERETSHIVGT